MLDSTYSVLVLCRETLLREAVTDAIDCRSGAIVAAAAILSSNLRDELNFDPDIVIYVDTGNDGEDIQRDAANAEAFRKSHWILMSDRHNSPLLARLMDLKARMSLTGLNLSRHALTHLVGLSAHGHEVRLDDHDDIVLSEERNDILNAGLVASQWRLLRYLGSGMSNKEIAREERTSVNTVKVRVRALLNRLDVANRTQAAVKVAKAGLCSGGETNRTNVVEYHNVETKNVADAVG
ncbi:LuxR C-terminal-related transcriptional regulator [Sphingopyxis sp. JAI128]|uniref:helix-turn-helix transcriptional regulator n=1 Tax=Sphingopyxis sp. JAI128 TaxID=2723066 RepID=UPI00161F6A20|nr:LuxR C-terminal-related transcriptional regulator [Sphingopyxis sp. JAI128]MBB6427476.1 DNA-binding NarL/FixJ family response regulator [Sphingopyxis sp. JAI128]